MNLISQTGLPLNGSFQQVILLVGLAAAIDYGIYLVSRYRRDRRAGYPELAAVVSSMGTVGKAILISAITTVLALSGLFFLSAPDFTSLVLAAIVAIIVAVAMAMTLMPTWMALVGDGLNRWGVPRIGHGFASAEGGGIAAGGIDRMLKRPAIYAPIAVGVLIVVALPLFAIDLGVNGIRSFSDDVDAKAPLLELEENFSLGLVQPASLVVDAGEDGSVFSSDVQAAIARLNDSVAAEIAASFCVLVVMFRSILLPLVAILLNLLAVGAAFGIMKLTFQDGHVLEGLLNYEATGIIEAWVPLFVFAIMFGISCDDLTFALSRVREGHERGEDTDTAVRGGLKSVAMTILAADLILAGVVGIFAFLRLIAMQQLGIAMVVAVVLGALLVIIIVMPALLRALGERIWYFPVWLHWVPVVASDDAALRTLYQAGGPGAGLLRTERERLAAAAAEPTLES